MPPVKRRATTKRRTIKKRSTATKKRRLTKRSTTKRSTTKRRATKKRTTTKRSTAKRRSTTKRRVTKKRSTTKRRTNYSLLKNPKAFKKTGPGANDWRPSARYFYDAGRPIGYRVQYGDREVLCLKLDRNGRPFWGKCDDY